MLLEWTYVLVILGFSLRAWYEDSCGRFYVLCVFSLIGVSRTNWHEETFGAESLDCVLLCTQFLEDINQCFGWRDLEGFV